MGLDKWLKTEHQAKKSIKKEESSDQVKKINSKVSQKEIVERQKVKLKKYTLNCPNAKCKYQRIIMKKQLTEIDKKCPRCNKEMKIK